MTYDQAYQAANKEQIHAYKRVHYKKNKQQWQRRDLRVKYGLSLERFDEMRKEQEYCCAICGAHESTVRDKRLHVDHDHKTGDIRGLLCTGCNMALGAFKDDPSLVQKAANYLLDKRL